MSERLIASMKLIGVDRNGTEREFTVGVGIPVERPTGGWACPTLTQDFEEPRPIVGEDSLQAICLGLGFIRARLEHFLERGGRLLLAESREDVPLAQLDVLFGKAV